jgi:nucleotide-binding universal stress UspA family protein
MEVVMRVLVAVEDEKYADAIVDFLAQHRWTPDTEFKLIHAVEPLLVGSYMSACPSAYLSEITEQSTKYGQQLLESTKSKLMAKLPDRHVFAEVFTEIPKFGILQQAHDWKANLIVLGSHGRRGMSRFLLGSVAEAVSSHAECSVVIVRLPVAARGNEDKAAERAKTAVGS